MAASSKRTDGAFTVSLRSLPRRSGEAKSLERTAAAPDGLLVGLAGIAPGSAIRFALQLEAVGEGVLVSGRADAELTGQCSRCLAPIARPFGVFFQELYVYPGRDGEGENLSLITDEAIDLEPAVRDALLLDLPLAPLCGDDCLGLCASCGANLNDDPAHSHGPAVDIRWRGLSGWVASQAD
ncbi:MAG: DUF177 domain-containing protein [Propionibacteriaceae bacterium]|jgi:uncharacterized protein|nr:DUF177 domain-containing protein [Propionibacteriaceae bacterium]